MHPVHQAFVAKPVVCRLIDLFDLLDRLEVRERNQVLGPVYQEFFGMAPIKVPPSMAEEEAMEEVYNVFKEKAAALVPHVHWSFVIVGVVTTTLMWLQLLSDEGRLEEAIDFNRADMEAVRQRYARNEISQEQHDRKIGEIEERINNLPSDMLLRRELYDLFCTQVVDRLPQKPA